MNGRPPHEPTEQTRKQASMLAGMGLPQDQIGRLLGIGEVTLRKYYADELQHGMAQANAKVAQSLFARATGDSPQAVTAAIFWLKARAGWRDVASVELTGRNGGPIETSEETARDRVKNRIARLAAGLPLLPKAVEADVAETEANGD